MRKIDKDKRVFLHKQFYALLRKEIESGKYKPGEYIPSERELVERYSLSRTTIRQGIAQLISEGWLCSVPGTGTFVSEVISAREKKTRPKSKNIALVLKLPYSPLDSPYYSKIFRSMQEEVARRGYHFSFYSFTEESKLDLLSVIRERDLDGVVFIGRMKEGIVLDVYKNKTPLVVVDNYINKKGITAVIPDNQRGGFEVTRYLTDLGHKKIYFLGVRPDDIVSAERFNGYKEALDQAGIPYGKEFSIKDSFSVSNGYSIMEDILKSGTLPTAIVAINDEVAIGAMKALSEKSGLSVPGDISVTGFDDIDWAAHTSPSLTTVRIQKEETGVLAVKFLIEQIENEDFTDVKVVTPVELIIRSSCSAPSKG
ncbi:MAG: GntR family transcriptional regulator [Candidatus Omnitrophota bacterium]|nr:GntR family transcriptional regulator [Candidatus Omnitrophota bacterium]